MHITKNRVISIDYTLRDAQNQFLNTSSDSESMVYLHGYENILPGLEKVLEGKTEGDTFTVTLSAADAYGERDESLILQVPLDNFEEVGTIKAGMQFETSDGSRLVTVTQVEGSTVTVDANHPMAGMDLTFDITVVSIREASPEEISHGHPHVPGHTHAHGHNHNHCDGCGGCG
jgi:FKBP-type peptidyl-prolyl cis-trans isomerase SlyD